MSTFFGTQLLKQGDGALSMGPIPLILLDLDLIDL